MSTSTSYRVNAFYAQMLAGDETHRKLSARSVSYIATILHRAFRDAIRWQAIVRNPADAADPPKSQTKPEMHIWSAAELGEFLAGISDDRLSGAWWLLATTGMRRGEVLGLRWADVDLANGLLRITRTLITTEARRKGEPGMSWGTPKTAKGRRSVALDDTTVAALKAHRSRQLEERLSLGESYADQDLVVCLADGTPLHPKTLSYYFTRHARRLGLPTIRLHDYADAPTPRWRCEPASIPVSFKSDSATRTLASRSTPTATSISKCKQPPPRWYRHSSQGRRPSRCRSTRSPRTARRKWTLAPFSFGVAKFSVTTSVTTRPIRPLSRRPASL